VVRWRGFAASAEDGATRNSLASLCLWGIPASSLIVALTFWDNTTVLQIAVATFVVLYTLLYRQLVLFNLPRWAVMRAQAEAVHDDALVDGQPK
jgi:UDP-GlcNAc:undecaprenyl-phosphate/decaprenyl-phosphate GlcNAc-1-phosphate transferase